jgi:hypothetical protein
LVSGLAGQAARQAYDYIGDILLPDELFYFWQCRGSVKCSKWLRQTGYVIGQSHANPA